MYTANCRPRLAVEVVRYRVYWVGGFQSCKSVVVYQKLGWCWFRPTKQFLGIGYQVGGVQACESIIGQWRVSDLHNVVPQRYHKNHAPLTFWPSAAVALTVGTCQDPSQNHQTTGQIEITAWLARGMDRQQGKGG